MSKMQWMPDTEATVMRFKNLEAGDTHCAMDMEVTATGHCHIRRTEEHLVHQTSFYDNINKSIVKRPVWAIRLTRQCRWTSATFGAADGVQYGRTFFSISWGSCAWSTARGIRPIN